MSAPPSAKRAAAYLFVLACPLIAVVFVLKPKKTAPEPNPIRLITATPVTAAPPWSETPLGGNIPYQWYSQSAFFYSRADHSFAASDSAPGKPDPRAGVAASYHAVGGDLEDLGPAGPGDWLLSPNRRWLLTYVGAPNHRRWVAMTLDGTRHVTFPARFNFRPFVCWKGDSSGWIELYRGQNAPNVASYSLTPAAAPEPAAPLPVTRENDYGRPELLGGIGADAFIMATWAEDGQHRIPLRIVRLPHSAAGESVLHRIKIPLRASLMETEMSPDGHRLAWVFIVPAQKQRGFQLPLFKSRTPDFDQQLWVSNVDGGGMRRIAAAGPQAKEAFTGIHFLRWVPDGSKISFVDNDTIYTVPAS